MPGRQLLAHHPAAGMIHLGKAVMAGPLDGQPIVVVNMKVAGRMGAKNGMAEMGAEKKPQMQALRVKGVMWMKWVKHMVVAMWTSKAFVRVESSKEDF